jgi:hypothetical protein
VKAVALVELVLLLEESIGGGWRRWLLLVDAVVLGEPVRLLAWRASLGVDGGGYCWCSQGRWSIWWFSWGGGASALVGEGGCCWVMQWYLSS